MSQPEIRIWACVPPESKMSSGALLLSGERARGIAKELALHDFKLPIIGFNASRRAEEYAHRYQTHYDAVVRLDCARDLGEQCRSIATFYELVDKRAGSEEATLAIDQTLRAREEEQGNVLIIFDNASTEMPHPLAERSDFFRHVLIVSEMPL